MDSQIISRGTSKTDETTDSTIFTSHATVFVLILFLLSCSEFLGLAFHQDRTRFRGDPRLVACAKRLIASSIPWPSRAHEEPGDQNQLSPGASNE